MKQPAGAHRSRHGAAAHRAPADPIPSPPGAWLMLLEGRAPWEFAATLAARPWFRRLPAGDGHPVVVFPGLGASDITTVPLRRFLAERGYTPYPWQQGLNFGPRRGVLDGCRSLVQQAADRHRERVSLIGWSLGGLYAREVAKDMPELTRCVITLGTPFAGHPRATNAWRFFELVSGQRTHDAALLAGLRQPPPRPTTSIYSRSDGIVAWPCSVHEPSCPMAENIEVHASHLGMGMNPLALYVIADRLAQDPQRWQRFGLHGARRWFYKVTPLGSPALAPTR